MHEMDHNTLLQPSHNPTKMYVAIQIKDANKYDMINNCQVFTNAHNKYWIQHSFTTDHLPRTTDFNSLNYSCPEKISPRKKNMFVRSTIIILSGVLIWYCH